MYTQCEHCQAIFEVSMREVTVADGKLRCGECHQVFNAMASLSTTIPTPYSEKLAPENSATNQSAKPQNEQNTRVIHTQNAASQTRQAESAEQRSGNNLRWLKVAAIALSLLLMTQVLYNNRHFLTGRPLHAPDKIEMLNNNVFAHPNEKGVLLIAASIENHAGYKQPYPVIEVSMSNAESRLVALRRFRPAEYLENDKKNKLMPVNEPVNLRIKIADPGSEATRFQFKFM